MTSKTEEVVVSEGDKIWEEIRRLPLEIYALAGQKVEDHIIKLGTHGSSLIVKPKAPAALPALETVLQATGEGYQIQTAEGGFIMVCRTPEALINEAEEYILFPRPNGKVDKIPRKKLYG